MDRPFLGRGGGTVVSTIPLAIVLELDSGVWPVTERCLALAKSPTPYRASINPADSPWGTHSGWRTPKEACRFKGGYLSSLRDRCKALFG